MRFGEAVRPEGEAPHGDPLGTAGTDRSTGPVHIRLNKQQQIRQGNKRSASASPGGRSWNGPPASTGLTAPLARIWVCPTPAPRIVTSRFTPTSGRQTRKTPFLSWITAPGPAAEAASRAACPSLLQVRARRPQRYCAILHSNLLVRPNR